MSDDPETPVLRLHPFGPIENLIDAEGRRLVRSMPRGGPLWLLLLLSLSRSRDVGGTAQYVEIADSLFGKSEIYESGDEAARKAAVNQVQKAASQLREALGIESQQLDSRGSNVELRAEPAGRGVMRFRIESDGWEFYSTGNTDEAALRQLLSLVGGDVGERIPASLDYRQAYLKREHDKLCRFLNRRIKDLADARNAALTSADIDLLRGIAIAEGGPAMLAAFERLTRAAARENRSAVVVEPNAGDLAETVSTDAKDGATETPILTLGTVRTGSPNNAGRSILRSWQARLGSVAAILAATGILFGLVQPFAGDQLTSASVQHLASSSTALIGWWPDRDPVFCGTKSNVCSGTDFPALDRYVGLRSAPWTVHDERAFLNAEPVGQRTIGPSDPLKVRAGELVRILTVVDNAATNILTKHINARGVRLEVLLPDGCHATQELEGFLSQSPPHHEVISDSVTLTSPEPLCLIAIAGSAHFSNSYGTFSIPTSGLFGSFNPSYGVPFERDGPVYDGTRGDLLGCRQINGVLPGTFQCAGQVSFTLLTYRPGHFPEAQLQRLEPKSRSPT
jgi:hypothetical protein